MDPASAVGLVSSVFALIGVTTKILHSLDSLVERWEEASARIISLRSLVASFEGSLDEIYVWMQAGFRSIQSSESFLKNLETSIEGCSMLLGALEFKVEALCAHPGRISKRDRANLLWSDSGIKELIYHLDCQTTPLLLLLQCRTLRQQQQLLSSEDKRQTLRKMTDHTAQIYQIREAANTQQDGSTETLHLLLQNQDNELVKENLNAAIYVQHLNALCNEPEQSEASLGLNARQSTVGQVPLAKGTQASLRNGASGRAQYETLERALVEQKVAPQTTVPPSPSPEKALAGIRKDAALSTGSKPSKFRILVVGQAGVGKSTLCSKILGLSEDSAGVTHRGIGTALSKVWEPITDPVNNPNVILHDSGGFEAGSELAMQEIKKFVQHHREQTKLEDQLHCICRRPFQEAEKNFFKYIDPGSKIPLMIVMTQYDLRIKEHFLEWMDSPEAETMTREAGRRHAEKEAFRDYEIHYKQPVLSMIHEGTSYRICRVGFSKGSEVTDTENFGNNPIGTSALIAETLNCLPSERLRLIWKAAQRLRVDYLFEASIEQCCSKFWSVQKAGFIPIPLASLVAIDSAANRIEPTLFKIWAVRTEMTEVQEILEKSKTTEESPETAGKSRERTKSSGKMNPARRSISHQMTEAVYGRFDKTFEGDPIFLFLFGGTSLGPLFGLVTARAILRLIAGYILIFERFFWRYSQSGEEDRVPLTTSQIREELDQYSKYQRRTVLKVVQESIGLRNCYSKQAARMALEKAISTARQHSTTDLEPRSSVASLTPSTPTVMAGTEKNTTSSVVKETARRPDQHGKMSLRYSYQQA